MERVCLRYLFGVGNLRSTKILLETACVFQGQRRRETYIPTHQWSFLPGQICYWCSKQRPRHPCTSDIRHHGYTGQQVSLDCSCSLTTSGGFAKASRSSRAPRIESVQTQIDCPRRCCWSQLDMEQWPNCAKSHVAATPESCMAQLCTIQRPMVLGFRPKQNM